VVAISPDDFLVSLLEEDSDEVWEVINNKCKSYRNPPRTMKQFCQQIGKLVPNFAAKLAADDVAHDLQSAIADSFGAAKDMDFPNRSTGYED
jgi:hypothetical protein